MARIVELILTYERRGKGTQEDPMRLVPQLYTRKGTLVAETDPNVAPGMALSWAEVAKAGEE
jgi:hypothetical protein